MSLRIYLGLRGSPKFIIGISICYHHYQLNLEYIGWNGEGQGSSSGPMLVENNLEYIPSFNKEAYVNSLSRHNIVP